MIIGIGLGTTNSLAAVFENGAPRLLGPTDRQMPPSVVSLLDDALLVGGVAKTRLVTHPHETVAAFKRGMGTERDYPLGKRKMTAVELSAMVLKHLREMAEEDLGQPVRDAVISVHAYLNQLQRKAVYTAAQIAELNPVRLINEPTAAAIAYGLQDIRDEGSLLVFDLGGGTFDVSIIEVFEGVIEVRATAGDAFLGGEDFTKVIADHIAQEHNLKTRDPKVAPLIWGAAETLKHRLATEHTAEMSLSIDGRDMTIGLTRDRFAEISESLIERLQLPVLRAMHGAGLGKDDVGRVVLVGGATRMHLIRGLVVRLVHSLPEIGIDPDHVVALGAALQGGLTSKDSALDDVVMTDVTAFSSGINTSHKMGEQRFPGYFAPIIERNTTVPASRQQTFTSVQRGQQKLEINIYQGEAPMVDQNIKIGAIEVPLPRNAASAPKADPRPKMNPSRVRQAAMRPPAKADGGVKVMEEATPPERGLAAEAVDRLAAILADGDRSVGARLNHVLNAKDLKDPDAARAMEMAIYGQFADNIQHDAPGPYFDIGILLPGQITALLNAADTRYGWLSDYSATAYRLPKYPEFLAAAQSVRKPAQATIKPKRKRSNRAWIYMVAGALLFGSGINAIVDTLSSRLEPMVVPESTYATPTMDILVEDRIFIDRRGAALHEQWAGPSL